MVPQMWASRRKIHLSAIDDIITRLTEAASMDAAYDVARTVPRKMLLKVADQLHIEADGHGAEWIRWAITKEART
jgi:hypothetical protein